MAIRVWLAREDGSDKIYFEGLATPWPEVPEPERRQQGSKVVTVPGWDELNDKPIPGKTLRFRFGRDITGESFKLRIPLLEQAMVDDVLTLVDEEDALQYSADDGVTVYLVTPEPDEAVNPTVTPKAGFAHKGLFELEIILGKLEQLAP